MVKFKIVLLFVVSVFVSSQLMGQCVPNTTITVPGIYPDTLPVALVGATYNEVIQFKVPVDTVFQGNNATILSITVTGMIGLPAGFTYACVPSNCVFAGGSNGCAVLTGNPTVAQIGQYPLRVTISITGTVIGIPFPITIPDTVSKYTLVISQQTGVQIVKNRNLEVNQNFPNPSVTATTIEFTVPNAALADFKLYNVLGKELYSRTVSARAGKNTINFETRDYEPGIYMYTIKAGDAVVTRRLMIGRK